VTTEQHHRHNAVIFDLDGTLIDSAPDVAEALNKSLESVQRSRLPLKTIRKFIGHGARNMIQDALEATGGLEIEVTLDGMIERYLSYYKADPTERTQVYPGVFDVLEQLTKNHIPLGICTNKPFVMAEIVLDQLNLAPYFCGMTAGDDVKHPKPDGRHITETLCRMRTSKEGAVMVGDSESDLAAARDAGIGAVAVSYGYFSDSIDDRFIDMTIDTMTDLPSALQQLQKSS
jgi:phosphoglycolate phosphatase